MPYSHPVSAFTVGFRLRLALTYRWLVAASDGVNTFNSVVWKFTTQSPDGLPKVADDLDEIAEETSVAAPSEFELGQNFPNPFNPTTVISYAVPKTAEIKLAIYNVSGRLVKILDSGPKAPGRYNIVWNGTDQNGNLVSSGVYLYVLKADDFFQVKKLSLLR